MPPPRRFDFIVIGINALHLTVVVASRSIFPSYVSSAFIVRKPKKTSFGSSLYSERSYSSELDSAYEWLAESRALNDPSSSGKISWFQPDNTVRSSSERDATHVKRMPLYPLGAVHVPHSGENHTIINIEPKNVNMSMVSIFEIVLF